METHLTHLTQLLVDRCRRDFIYPPVSPNMHILILIQACACVLLTTSHKSATHRASVASVLAADDNCCQDLTLLSQLAGQVGALLDSTKQSCLT